MNIVKVTGVKTYSYHGCLPEETKIGGHYIVDIIMYTNFAEAAQTDDLSKTIDYVIVNQIVEEEMAIPSKLIEHVGQRIIDKMYATLPTLEKTTVEIRKICPPINGDVQEVSIIIEK